MTKFLPGTSAAKFAAALTLLFSLISCAARPPAPPPDPGRIIITKKHSFYYFDLKYSVGRLGDRLRVVGLIDNTYVADLDRFIVTLEVKDSQGRKLARTATDFFDITDMESADFVLDLPRLHGPCIFSFRCDYEHYDDMDEIGPGPRSFTTSDWNYFDDRINLP